MGSIAVATGAVLAVTFFLPAPREPHVPTSDFLLSLPFWYCTAAAYRAVGDTQLVSRLMHGCWIWFGFPLGVLLSLHSLTDDDFFSSQMVQARTTGLIV